MFRSFNEKFIKAKNAKEFWKYEKTHFRPFFIVFAILMLILTGLLLSQFLWLVSDKNIKKIILDKFHEFNSNSSQPFSDPEVETNANGFFSVFTIVIGLILTFNLVFTIIFIISWTRIYNLKSLLHMNKSSFVFISTMNFIGVVYFIAFLATIINRKNVLFADWHLFLIPVIYFAINFVFDLTVNRQIKIFIMANEQIARLEILKKNSHLFNDLLSETKEFNFGEFMKKVNEMNDKDKTQNIDDKDEFSDYKSTEEEAQLVDSEQEKEVVDSKLVQRMEYYNKLVQLPNEKLLLIAKKMNIFAAEEMDKEELISLILDINDQTKK
ncbi:hypothetical protein ACJA25_03365 [Mycoplasmopsis hyopharyngis]|uniref:hypothetical protein n=1 Tax=Mycoplasmopsis hyopharyngis TaxID=29558 RepID=UPI0038736BE6